MVKSRSVMDNADVMLVLCWQDILQHLWWCLIEIPLLRSVEPGLSPHFRFPITLHLVCTSVRAMAGKSFQDDSYLSGWLLQISPSSLLE